MTENPNTTQQINVLLCQCKYTEFVSTDSVEALCKGLKQAKIAYQIIEDFCGLAVTQDSCLPALVQTRPLYIIACYERALTALCAAGGVKLAEKEHIHFFNLRTQTPDNILAELLQTEFPKAAPPPILSTTSDWIPWFPVIDQDRCQNCKLCMNFCLFGVYSLSEDGQVQVENPANCKTHCPACARICPAQAIIFPKYTESPINGDVVPDIAQDQPKEPGCVNALMEGNIYDLLRKRSKTRKRFSTEPKPQTHLLKDLNEQLGIPLDVLNALSPADLARIQTKAKRPEGPTHD